MADKDDNLKIKVETLKKDITGLKSDIHEFQKMLTLINAAEGQASDEKELKAVDQQLDEL